MTTPAEEMAQAIEGKRYYYSDPFFVRIAAPDQWFDPFGLHRINIIQRTDKPYSWPQSEEAK